MKANPPTCAATLGSSNRVERRKDKEMTDSENSSSITNMREACVWPNKLPKSATSVVKVQMISATKDSEAK
jgi:hypothetical protein